MFGLQPQDLLVILIIALLLFGPKRLPDIGRTLGQTLRGFREVSNEVQQVAEQVQQPIKGVAETTQEAFQGLPLHAFVSSIIDDQCEDLKAERAAAKQAAEAMVLGTQRILHSAVKHAAQTVITGAQRILSAWLFEYSPAHFDTARHVYLSEVKKCDIFVLILGKEITRPVLREYAMARKYRKPCLVFLKKCERTPAAQAFVKKISGQVKWVSFVSARELENQLPNAVTMLAAEAIKRLSKREVAILLAFLDQIPKIELAAPETAESEPRIPVREPEPPPAEKPEPLFQTTTKRGRDGKRMILVPADWFWMGSEEGHDDEKPMRRVYLDAYYIDETPVTNGEYKRFVNATGHRVPFYDAEWAKPYNWDKLLRTFPIDKADHPVVLVDWDDASTYARWAGKRLPTEAQWEKAARGTDGRRYPWGNEEPDSTRCNFGENERGTTSVGKYGSRGDSLYHVKDMAGNVWEWCADWYRADYYKNSPTHNPKGPDSADWHVVRGGSWWSSADSVRASYRYGVYWHYWHNYVGFRCVE